VRGEECTAKMSSAVWPASLRMLERTRGCLKRISMTLRRPACAAICSAVWEPLVLLALGLHRWQSRSMRTTSSLPR